MTTNTNADITTNAAKAIRLDVRKYGSTFIGDLVWDDGKVWTGWQVCSRLGTLKMHARATFDGPIVRVHDKDV